ncbi:MAG TPA: hypothetical protein VFG23_07120 [Polyangia bacterium]|nr:hypothetical protein [Polyangia bacterium]
MAFEHSLAAEYRTALPDEQVLVADAKIEKTDRQIESRRQRTGGSATPQTTNCGG